MKILEHNEDGSVLMEMSAEEYRIATDDPDVLRVSIDAPIEVPEAKAPSKYDDLREEKVKALAEAQAESNTDEAMEMIENFSGQSPEAINDLGAGPPPSGDEVAQRVKDLWIKMQGWIPGMAREKLEEAIGLYLPTAQEIEWRDGQYRIKESVE